MFWRSVPSTQNSRAYNNMALLDLALHFVSQIGQFNNFSEGMCWSPSFLSISIALPGGRT